jgi:hypothetical protein
MNSVLRAKHCGGHFTRTDCGTLGTAYSTPLLRTGSDRVNYASRNSFIRRRKLAKPAPATTDCDRLIRTTLQDAGALRISLLRGGFREHGHHKPDHHLFILWCRLSDQQCECRQPDIVDDRCSLARQLTIAMQELNEEE